MPSWQHPARDLTRSGQRAGHLRSRQRHWLSQHAIPGTPEGIARLRAEWPPCPVRHQQLVLVREDIEGAALEGGECRRERRSRSRWRRPPLVEPGERAVVVGGPGIVQALEAGMEVVPDGRADAVLVGFTREFDYGALRLANATIRAERAGSSEPTTTPPTRRPRGRSPAAGPARALWAPPAATCPWWRASPRTDGELVRSSSADSWTAR